MKSTTMLSTSTLRRRKKQLGGRRQSASSSLSSPIIGGLISRLFAIGAVVYFLSMVLLVTHLPLPDSSFNDGRHHMLLFESKEESSEAAAAAVSSSAYSEKGHEGEEGASACLLVNDENPNLPEWIAYHYHTLPLRSLIVAVDPASRSSPSEILSRWNNSIATSLDVHLWNDDDYLYETTTTRQSDGTLTKTKKRIVVSRDIQGHRTRQNNFIVKCMEEFKRRNRTWVLLIDVDEYITFNRITNDDEDDEPNYPLEEAPEGIPTLINWMVEDNTITGWIVNDNNQTTISSSNLDETMRKSQEFTTGPLISQQKRQIQPGGIVTDTTGKQYFLRNDLIICDLTALDYAPMSMPIIKYFMINGNDETCGEIYNDIYYGMDNGT